jgi:hypothetical protein
MLKDRVKGRKTDHIEFTEKEKTAFELLKIFFIRGLILIHFKFDKSIKIETDISDL